MAFIIREKKQTKKARIVNKKGVKANYPIINSKIVSETADELKFDRSLIKEMLSFYFDFGHEVTLRKEIFKVPYVGSLKPRIKYTKRNQTESEDATI